MRNLRGWAGIWAAVKADTISLIAFEFGMFGFTTLTREVIFPALNPNGPVYWFMMQIAMVMGFVTTYPANWWLIKAGMKEAM
jgi:hypothetical protein